MHRGTVLFPIIGAAHPLADERAQVRAAGKLRHVPVGTLLNRVTSGIAVGLFQRKTISKIPGFPRGPTISAAPILSRLPASLRRLQQQRVMSYRPRGGENCHSALYSSPYFS